MASAWDTVQSTGTAQVDLLDDSWLDLPAWLGPSHGQRLPMSTSMRKKVADFVTNVLTTQQRQVIMLLYCEELTSAETAAVLELPESRVAQIHKDVVARVKAWLMVNEENPLPVA